MVPRAAKPQITLFGQAITPYTVKVVRALRLEACARPRLWEHTERVDRATGEPA